MHVRAQVQRNLIMRRFFNAYGWPSLDKMGQAITQGKVRVSEVQTNRHTLKREDSDIQVRLFLAFLIFYITDNCQLIETSYDVEDSSPRKGKGKGASYQRPINRYLPPLLTNLNPFFRTCLGRSSMSLNFAFLVCYFADKLTPKVVGPSSKAKGKQRERFSAPLEYCESRSLISLHILTNKHLHSACPGPQR